jgi:hypothetical protein
MRADSRRILVVAPVRNNALSCREAASFRARDCGLDDNRVESRGAPHPPVLGQSTFLPRYSPAGLPDHARLRGSHSHFLVHEVFNNLCKSSGDQRGGCVGNMAFDRHFEQ